MFRVFRAGGGLNPMFLRLFRLARLLRLLRLVKTVQMLTPTEHSAVSVVSRGYYTDANSIVSSRPQEELHRPVGT